MKGQNKDRKRKERECRKMNKTRNHLLCVKRSYGLMNSPYPLCIEYL